VNKPYTPIERLKVELLKGKTWRYLRYLHAREALKLIPFYDDVLVIGAGNGLAEIALAIEYPNKHFHLTDHDAAQHTFEHAKNFKRKYNLQNITFGSLNILQPKSRKYDVVYSVEVLEHIKNDKRAAKNMRALANKYVFCLVPFAEKSLNDNQEERKKAFKNHEHFVVGYDKKTLSEYFPYPLEIRGCYWKNEGGVFRQKLTAMDVSTIEKNYISLAKEASYDLKLNVQEMANQAGGIWVLSAKTRFIYIVNKILKHLRFLTMRR
jgi:SAM-dependent methyltransferase